MVYNSTLLTCRLVELQEELSEEALASRYCQELLHQLSAMQHHMKLVGPQQMSQERLMSVLSLLRPWELEAPMVAAAVKVIQFALSQYIIMLQFLITRIIYTVPHDYQIWLDYHTKKHTN